ncbi:MAG: AAA family ATPase [Solirubrobacteraceae bacterium]
MKLAVVGKGGVGKTSISGTLARLFARRGYPVLAIDGDPNPNLALALGVLPAQMAAMPGLSADLVEPSESGLRLTKTLEQVCSEYSLQAPDGVTLLAMRPAEKAGAG